MSTSSLTARRSRGQARRGADRAPRRPIVVYDSGVGGLTVARHLLRLRPQDDLVYVADNGWFPYGDKDDLALRARIYAVLHAVVERARPSAVVIACNTASTAVTATLDDLAADTPIFTVVPPVEQTVREVGDGTVALLGTPSTIRRSLVRRLVDQHAVQGRFVLAPSMDLVHLAEAKLASGRVDTAAVAAALDAVLPAPSREDVAGVILGCTHFPWLVEELRPFFPQARVWADPALAVAQQVEARLAETAPESGGRVPSRRLYLTSQHNLEELRPVFRRHGFAAGPLLPLSWVTPALHRRTG